MFDIDANRQVDTLEVVPEPFRPLYAEGDGNFTINPAFLPIVDAYVGTSRSLKQAQTLKKAANDEAAARRVALSGIKDVMTEFGLEGDDVVETLKTHFADMASKTAGGKQLQVDIAKVKQEAEARVRAQAAAKDEEIGRMRKSLEDHLLGEAAASALSKAKGSVELLMPHIKAHTRVVEEGGKYIAVVVDEAGDARVGRNGFMTIDELVGEMKGSATYARAFESEAPAGTGSQPGSMARRAPSTQAAMDSTSKIARGLGKLGR